MRRRGSHSSASSNSSWSSDSYSAESDLQSNEDSHYAGAQNEAGTWRGVTPAGVRDQLLRKTIRWVCGVRHVRRGEGGGGGVLMGL